MLANGRQLLPPVYFRSHRGLRWLYFFSLFINALLIDFGVGMEIAVFGLYCVLRRWIRQRV